MCQQWYAERREIKLVRGQCVIGWLLFQRGVRKGLPMRGHWGSGLSAVRRKPRVCWGQRETGGEWELETGGKVYEADGMDDAAAHRPWDGSGRPNQQLRRGTGLPTEGSARRGGAYPKDVSGTFAKLLIQRRWLNNSLN